MKKLFLIPIIFVLSQCQIKVDTQQSMAQEIDNDPFPSYFIANPPRGMNGESKIIVTVYERDGIEYRIFSNNSYDGKSIFVVNHTKELLEIELLKKQLTNTNN